MQLERDEVGWLLRTWHLGFSTSSCRNMPKHAVVCLHTAYRNCVTVDILILTYLLTAIGLSPGGSSTVHIYTQTVHRTIKTNNT